MSKIAELPGFIQVFSDGTVYRFPIETAPASNETTNGYMSKDVILDPSKKISARIFLPDTPSSVDKLPVVAFFHGGGFCMGSTKGVGAHIFLGDLSVASKSIVFSVDYRLTPENKLPIAYEDCYSSLEWLSHNLNSEPWLEKADLSRVFLSGESAGGNIVHQVGIRAIKNRVSNVTIKGLLPIHPFFGSEKRTENEMAEGSTMNVAVNDMFWSLSLPKGSNRDYYGCNFEMAEVSSEEWGRLPAVVIHTAGMDFLKERGVLYAEFLKKKGVKDVKIVEEERESHTYHVLRPKSEATHLLQKQISEFIHSF